MTPMPIGTKPLTAWTMVDVIAPAMSRPERPKWVDHAGFGVVAI